MSPDSAITYVRRHGVVLESAAGPVPTLAWAVAGAPVRGSWWSHPEGKRIFRILQHVRGSGVVLTCTVVGGKVTFVHRRLWAPLVRVADRLDRRRLAWIRDVHTEAGSHRRDEIPFPDWVPPDVLADAERLSPGQAEARLREWLDAISGS